MSTETPAAQRLIGEDVYKAYAQHYYTTEYEDLPADKQRQYQLTAQALNVKLGLIPADQVNYLVEFAQRIRFAQEINDLCELLIELPEIPGGGYIDIKAISNGIVVVTGHYHYSRRGGYGDSIIVHMHCEEKEEED